MTPQATRPTCVTKAATPLIRAEHEPDCNASQMPVRLSLDHRDVAVPPGGAVTSRVTAIGAAVAPAASSPLGGDVPGRATGSRDWHKDLNAAQRQAATAPDGPVLVVAGAGTGKTRVIEHRVIELLERGARPESILMLTFTRRAAKEMLERVAARVPEGRRVMGGTFHAFATQTLRRYAGVLGLPRSFTILDQEDAVTAVGRCMSRARSGRPDCRFPGKETAHAVISKATNTRRSIQSILAADCPQFVPLTSEITRIRDVYTRYKLDAGAVDYDDLLTFLLVLLQQPGVAAELAARHRHLLVDEYQDTNLAQGEIVAHLGRAHGNVTVVGDDAQSIYSFRGACRENILGFPRLFPGRTATVVTLEENYRSQQPILDVANVVLSHMPRRFDKRLRAAAAARPRAGSTVRDPHAGDRRPVLRQFEDAIDEAEWVATSILAAHAAGVRFDDHAVLYRSSQQANELQLALAARRIPYRVFGGARVSERAHVKDLMAVLRVERNGADVIAWTRVLALHEGVGPRIGERLATAAANAARAADLNAAFAAATGASGRRAPARRAVAWLRQTIDGIRSIAEGMVAERLAVALEQYRPLLAASYPDHERRAGDLESLRHAAARYSSIDDLLADLSLDPQKRRDADGATEPEDEGLVTVSTIHWAKGLEWEHVYLIGLADGRFPGGRCLADADALEEERRLLYVAVTRAKVRLMLSANASPGCFDRVSRFLDRPDVLPLLRRPAMAPLPPAGCATGTGHHATPASPARALSEEQLLRAIQGVIGGVVVVESDASQTAGAPMRPTGSTASSTASATASAFEQPRVAETPEEVEEEDEDPWDLDSPYPR
jgi:DNA helicase-2/ATP-dependent DNA helicase PcrA